MHTISPQTHILFIMPRSKKGLGRWHNSGTGNNQGRLRTTPRDNRGFNRNDCHSKSIDTPLAVISVSLPLNNSVINPPQMSSVCQHSKSNELSSPVIPKLPPWNYPFINPTQLSSVRQKSSSSSPKTTHESKASSNTATKRWMNFDEPRTDELD